MKCYLVFACLLIQFVCLSNDGAYYSYGGTFYPIKETRVSIEKEILSFHVANRTSEVNVYFEFLNPTDSIITLDVGFVAPLPFGDVGNEEYITERITDFVVQFDNQILKYDIKYAECPNCELVELDQIEETAFVHQVFLFQLAFKPGLNKVQHSYQFPASSQVQVSEFYSYTLTTGSMWANNTISEFTLNIDIGDNTYFFVTDSFNETADWNIIGTGNINTEVLLWHSPREAKLIRILTGYVSVTCVNFSPSHDLTFGFADHIRFIDYSQGDFTSNEITCLVERTIAHTELDLDRLKILRNCIYAKYSYSFASQALTNYFSQFEWYIPDPNISQGNIELSVIDERFLTEILEREKELKHKKSKR